MPLYVGEGEDIIPGMPKEKIITSIDIGSTKISSAVAAITDNKVSIIGVSGSVPSKGISKGNVVDIDAAL